MGNARTENERMRDARKQYGFSKLLLACGFAAMVPAILLVALFVTVKPPAVVAATLPAPQSAKWAAQMPGGQAKNIIVAKCELCHSLARIVISHRPKEEWESLVGQMIDHGAPVTSEELPIIVDYLATNFGRKDTGSPIGTPGAATSDSMVDPDQAQFSAVPDSMGLPTGVQMSVVSGDPSKTGLFSILLKFPTGAVIAPHWLAGDENIVCLRGTFQFGEGDDFSAEKLRTLNPGAVLHIPAQMHHFSQAKDSAIILVYGDGPLAITFK